MEGENKKEYTQMIMSLCEKNKITIHNMLNHISSTFCDNYCKYSAYIEDEDELYTHCDKCPFVNFF